MRILDKIFGQISAVRLPLYAVTLTAVPRQDTPLLLMLHWHGFGRDLALNLPEMFDDCQPVPGTALQINERWQSFDMVEVALLDAAWQLGAWDVEREERRGCNTIGASEQEALECQQAFGEHPTHATKALYMITDAPDRADLMNLGAHVGYIRWQFRPVMGGVWQQTAEDDTLELDGSRNPPCPVTPLPIRGGKLTRTTYRLGKVSRVILP